MHIGILIGFFNKILKYINLKKKTIIISFILFFFAFLTNFSSSILRATLFYIILSLKKIYKLNIHDLKLLLIVAFILIIFNPFIIYDIGFIYSFIITGGIILNKKYITGNYFQQLFKLSIITFLYSLPITIYLNYEINLLSVFANMIFVPFVSIIFYPTVLVTFLIPYLSFFLNILIIIIEFLNEIIVNCSFRSIENQLSRAYRLDLILKSHKNS